MTDDVLGKVTGEQIARPQPGSGFQVVRVGDAGAPIAIGGNTGGGPARRRWPWMVAAGGTAAVAVVVAFFSLRSGSDSTSYRRPVCTPATTAQCVESWERTQTGIKVTFLTQPTPSVYRIGTIGDVLMVGNWFCGGRETLAIYRPETGDLRYFRYWPDPNSGAPDAGGVGDSTGIVGATTVIGDFDRNGCADIGLRSALKSGLRSGNTETRFLPSVQPGRLAPLGADVGLGDQPVVEDLASTTAPS